MAWSSSTRSSELPPDWESIRRRILRRDGWVCQIGSAGCLREASDVDHIVRGSDHSDSNLRAACSRCHNSKSSAEGHRRRAELRARRFRPTERHPGSR